MFNMGSIQKKMMDRFFRKVDNVVWDLMSGKIGIVTKDGVVSLNDDGSVDVNLMEQFGMPLPAFAQNTPLDSLKTGDLIFSSDKVLGWITKLRTPKKKSFTIIKPNGTGGNWTPPNVTMMGFDAAGGAMVLRSLINSLPGTGLGDMQNMLMPMLAMGGGSMDMDSIMPLLLMSQMGGMGGPEGGGGMNMQGMMMPMMMMSMMKGDSNPMKSFMTNGDSNKGFFDVDDD